jgi:hypothetical protein
MHIYTYISIPVDDVTIVPEHSPECTQTSRDVRLHGVGFQSPKSVHRTLAVHGQGDLREGAQLAAVGQIVDEGVIDTSRVTTSFHLATGGILQLLMDI